MQQVGEAKIEVYMLGGTSISQSCAISAAVNKQTHMLELKPKIDNQLVNLNRGTVHLYSKDK